MEIGSSRDGVRRVLGELCPAGAGGVLAIREKMGVRGVGKGVPLEFLGGEALEELLGAGQRKKEGPPERADLYHKKLWVSSP